MKKKILMVLVIIGMIFITTGCASWDRSIKSINSDISGGLYRTVNVYSYNGEKIATYEGKIDIEETDEGNKVLFDLNGKRYAYYNAFVEVIEK